MRLIEREEILDALAVRRALARLAREIVEQAGGTQGLVLVGIRRGGVPLAQRLAADIARAEDVAPPPVGAIDVTLYRDDAPLALPRPVVGKTELPFEVTDALVVLVDDVLFTGRTVRAAMDELMDFGRPRAIRLAVLVDRGLRELPIRADFVGKSMATRAGQQIQVELTEMDAPADRVVLCDVVSGDGNGDGGES
jgi:pyrimidine operon attenuation protein/uracil phosphoribosyltransferase